MSRRYHAHFPSVALSRLEILDRVSAYLVMSGMKYTGECAELTWDREVRAYVYAYNELNFEDEAEALLATEEWSGTVLEYSAPLGDRSLTFFRSDEGGRENFGFDDTSGLYSRLIESERSWLDFEMLIVDLLEALGSSFATYHFNTPYVEMTEVALFDLLAQMPLDAESARPPLIVLKSGLPVPEGALQSLHRCYLEHRAGDFVLYRETTWTNRDS